jgi:gyrB: DNA gyrase, B subunit
MLQVTVHNSHHISTGLRKPCENRCFLSEISGKKNACHIRKRKGYTVQRYKGLGEMDPKQLASTTMDPKTRILQRVSIEDAVVADRAVRELMGSEVGYRREYIEKHAHDARFLDA